MSTTTVVSVADLGTEDSRSVLELPQARVQCACAAARDGVT